mmetsp:Transcript_85347/g.182904  ORF Transcript_85347/g.182904 Transcript_85347/m.182904 type:complete len:240 (+) Transcript_85347:604-1323(+)
MMVKVRRKTAERMVPLRLLSKENLRFPVKSTVLMTVRMMFLTKKTMAPKTPGMPPSPSGGGFSSSTAAGAAEALEAPPPATFPFFVRCCMFFSMVPGLWIITHSSVASVPTYAMIAWTPPGWMGIHFVTSMASPKRITHASSCLLCFATSSKEIPPASPPPAAAATGAAAPPPPSFPLIVRCCMFFSTVPGLWIICHSSVASAPAKAMMAWTPPGWMGIHFVTSITSPKRTIQQSSCLL